MSARAMAALLAIGWACAGASGTGSGGSGRIQASWVGSDTGKIATAAAGQWCGRLKFLEIQGTRGDSGIALVLFPVDTIRPDSYAVGRPAQAKVTPPSSAVGLRWFAETAVKGYRSDSGTVVLESSARGRVSGRFGASMQSATEGSRVRVTGSFTDVAIERATRGCEPVAAPQADTAAADSADDTGAGDEGDLEPDDTTADSTVD